jgi:proteasome lid subunit RPN8/RPN11
MRNMTPDRTTPIYLKESDDEAWPTEPPVFYLLSGSGLFLCRNHPFFRSSVRVDKGPAELASHRPLLVLSYPKIPCALLETAVGFFDRVGRLHSAEAAVVLVWNTTTERVGLVVPPQVSLVRKSWYGDRYPLDVKYEMPALAGHLQAIGDIHCHVDGEAYASYVDKHDETYRPGIHVVVGRIYQEPPQFHIQAVVDGTRFDVAPLLILEGYTTRRTSIPKAWLDKVRIDLDDPYSPSTWRSTDGGTGSTTGYRTQPWNSKQDGDGQDATSTPKPLADPHEAECHHEPADTNTGGPLPGGNGGADAERDAAGPPDNP